MEIWKDIKGYDGIYQISNMGRLRSLDRVVTTKAGWTQKHEGILIQTNSIQNSGYIAVPLHKNGKSVTHLLHRLVADAFAENPNNYECVNHKDQNKLNNRADNLEWCTAYYNCHYGDGAERSAETQRKEFYQIDMNGNVVKKWKGFNKIQRELGYQKKLIYLCCIGKRESYIGYKWAYAE